MIDTIENLFKVEDHLENAVILALKNKGINYQMLKRRDYITIEAPWIQVSVSLGDSDIGFMRNWSNRDLPEKWDVTIEVTISSKRSISEFAHMFITREARYVMYNYRESMNEDVSPYFQLEALKDAGTQYSIDQEKQIDRTQLTFSAVAIVRPTAWPNP